MDKRTSDFARRHWLELLIALVGVFILAAAVYPMVFAHTGASTPANAPAETPAPTSSQPLPSAAADLSFPKLSPAQPLRAAASLEPGPPPHLTIRGAAYDPRTKTPVINVSVLIDGHAAIPAVYGIPDPKNALALHLQDDRIGFRSDAPLADVTGGSHRIAFRVTTRTGVANAREALPVTVAASPRLPPSYLNRYHADGLADVPVDAIEGTGYAIVVGKQTDFPKVLPRSSGITFVGWAVDKSRTAPAHRLVFRLDGATFLEATMGNDRLDVATSFHNPAVRFCGFSLRIPADLVPPGQHRLQAYVLDDARLAYEVAAPVYTIRTAAR